MKIQWLGHSAFKLVESTGTTIVTDPYHSYVGYDMPEVSADVVTISHSHRDHSYLAGVSGKPLVLSKQGAYEVKGVHISSTITYHDEQKGKERGENLIFRFRMDGVDVCHLGDLGEECNPLLVEILMPVNVLIIPIGGVYTINAEQAKEYVDMLMPDVVIPMHFKTKDCNFNLDKLSEFLELFDDEDIVYADGETLEFDRADFDSDRTKVYVMEKVK